VAVLPAVHVHTQCQYEHPLTNLSSANGAHFQVYRNSTLIGLYGTSLAAPLFASVITLINQQRTLVGKGPVGFINPALYQSESPLLGLTTSEALLSPHTLKAAGESIPAEFQNCIALNRSRAVLDKCRLSARVP